MQRYVHVPLYYLPRGSRLYIYANPLILGGLFANGNVLTSNMMPNYLSLELYIKCITSDFLIQVAEEDWYSDFIRFLCSLFSSNIINLMPNKYFLRTVSSVTAWVIFVDTFLAFGKHTDIQKDLTTERQKKTDRHTHLATKSNSKKL